MFWLRNKKNCFSLLTKVLILGLLTHLSQNSIEIFVHVCDRSIRRFTFSNKCFSSVSCQIVIKLHVGHHQVGDKAAVGRLDLNSGCHDNIKLP